MDKNKWRIELSEEQLNLISEALEFTSRFACGQIGFSYLPKGIQDLFHNKEENKEKDWDIINKRIDKYNKYGDLIKSSIHPELSSENNISYGVNKITYADNLYDLYKFINHIFYLESQINVAPNDRISNVNKYFTKFGNLSSIKVNKL